MTVHWVTLVQIVVAAVLGAAIGLERELTAQSAGLRTHMLVCLGAALFTLAGVHVFDADATRVAAQVVTGIGFLGGGAILREGANVRGLTTAATLWVTAAIGLAIGFQSWFAAVTTTIVALVVLIGVRWLEREFVPTRRQMEVILTLTADAKIDEVETRVLALLPHSKVLRLVYSATGKQQMELVGKPEDGESLSTLAEHLRGLDGVDGVDIQR